MRVRTTGICVSGPDDRRRGQATCAHKALPLVLLGCAMFGTGAAAQTDEAPSTDPYRFFTRFDPNSSARKSNPEPGGYVRVADSVVSGFGIWMRNFPMRSPDEPLIDYSGSFLAAPNVIGGALDLSTPAPAQNARGVLYRLMVEYSRVDERELDVIFPGIGEDSVSLYRFLTGKYSTSHGGRELYWRAGEETEISDQSLFRFSLFAMSVTSYHSLIRDCREVTEGEALPGDVFIQSDSSSRPEAHLSIVLDIAVRDTSQPTNLALRDGSAPERLFLFANSLTPATNFHIIRPIKAGKGNWFYPAELQGKLKGMGPGRFFRLPYEFLW
ncbi:MAG: DUF4846 domain-containing protein [Candidatus Zixiibacteriota bacterium]